MLTVGGGRVQISEQPAEAPDARVNGSVKAWVRALGPNADTGDLTFTGDRALADALLTDFVAAATAAGQRAAA